MDKNGVHIGTVKQVWLTFLPAFELYENDNYIGRVDKKLSFLNLLMKLISTVGKYQEIFRMGLRNKR